MAGGIATRYSPAERESMAAWDAWCEERDTLTAAEWKLSEELDLLALGKIKDILQPKRQTTTEKQRETKRAASKRFREAHPNYYKTYYRKYKEANQAKLRAQDLDRYRRRTASEAEEAASA